MLSGLHIILTYTCTYECDHCFLFCSPRSQGTLTLDQVEAALDQGVDAGIDHIFVEGGEPFLFYPLMVETLRLACVRDLEAGIVTNCYWATARRDARAWLAPIADLGVMNLSVSDDEFHAEDPEASPAKIAAQAAFALGVPNTALCIDAPSVSPTPLKGDDGAVVGGNVLFKGRAAETLIEGLPRRHFTRFDSCPHEELASPTRVHLDPFGNVFVCQGISIGNIWKTPLKRIMESYRPEAHPIVGPLLQGGPAALAEKFGLPEEDEYVDHCHLCFLVRRSLLDAFPDELCPTSVYGDD